MPSYKEPKKEIKQKPVKQTAKMTADIERMKAGPSTKLEPTRQTSAPKKHSSQKTVMPHGHN